MSTRFYSALGLLAVVSLAGILLWGPGKDDKPDQGTLWEEDWEVIEYFETKEGGFHSRFIRGPGLLRDLYYVETPHLYTIDSDTTDKNDASKAQKYVRHRGSNLVKNIFSSWRQPRLLSYYKERKKPKQSGVKTAKTKQHEQKKGKQNKTGSDDDDTDNTPSRSPIESGLNGSAQRIFFYKRPSAKPVVLTLGNEIERQRLFIRSSKAPELTLTIPAHLKNSLTNAPLRYRSKEILHFPTQSYIREVQLQAASLPDLKMRQREVKKEKRTEKLWNIIAAPGSLQNAEIPVNLGRQLEYSLKGLKIAHFADEKGMQKYGPVTQLWEQAKSGFLNIKVKIKEGDSYSLHIRQPAEKISIDKSQLFLLKSDKEPFIFFIRMEKTKQILDRIKSIRDHHLAAQKEKEKKPSKKKPQGNKNKKPRP